NTPSWREMADKMLEKLSKEGFINLNQQYLFSALPVKAKMSIASARFRKEQLSYDDIIPKCRQNNNSYDPYEQLAELAKSAPNDIRNFITTNYDLMLHCALERKELLDTSKEFSQDILLKDSQDTPQKPSDYDKFHTFYSPDEFMKQQPEINQKVLLYLHGSMKDESKIKVSIWDYLYLYSSLRSGENSLQNSLIDILEGQSIIFTGYSLDELVILELLYRNTLNDNGIFHFHLLPYLSYQREVIEQLAEHWRKLKIMVFPYNVDRNWYEGINQIIKYIKKLIEQKGTREQMPRIKQLNLIDEWIANN
ncbi:MAG: SIR2 family protein, partial [Rhodobacteraceae bacterium]|nr:SIR2 family protein [Paracoccaceae bacterium]